MSDGTSPREARIIAALGGELGVEEQRRFDADCAADPTLRADTDDARAMIERIGRADLSWSEREVPEGLAERVQRTTTVSSVPDQAADGAFPAVPDDSPAQSSEASPRPADLRRARERRGLRRFSTATLGAAAASALIVGGVAGAGVSRLVEAPQEGPPGTLGAVEPVSFTGEPSGTSVTASVVAHTWGTETLLEVDGLRVGEAFEVVLTRSDGAELVSGTFLGSEQTVTCSMNAAVLRQDVAEVEIRDASGSVVASTALPDV